MLAIGFGSAVFVGSTATAQEPQCFARYRFNWGQHSQGHLATKAGTACRLRLLMRGRSAISSVQVIRGPSNGTASLAGPAAIRFQPRPGFTGHDSMVVRYSGTGAAGRPAEATVTFAIIVN